jgi:peptidoglycan/LPS O-acetylase OafA/YrhL
LPHIRIERPLWSLANEFWYYVLFPLALFAALAWSERALGRALLLTFGAVCIAGFVGWEIIAGFLIWLSGWVLLQVYSIARLKKHLLLYLLLSLVLLSACLPAARLNHVRPLGGDLSVGLAFALFLFGAMQIDLRQPHEIYSRATHFFAEFSYSLYLLHFPFLLFLRARITPAERWQPDAPHLVFGLEIGAAVLGFAWFVSLFTENKTRAARDYIRQFLLPHEIRGTAPASRD